MDIPIVISTTVQLLHPITTTLWLGRNYWMSIKIDIK